MREQATGIKLSYTAAVRFLDALPGRGISEKDYYEVNRLSGNPMSPSIMRENWEQAKRMTLWEKRDGTEYLRSTLREMLLEGISKADSFL
jgi:hypothetical protein